MQWLDWLVDAAKGLGKRLESFEAWQLATLSALKAECRGLTGLWKLPKGFGKRLESFEAPLNAVKAKSGGLTGSYWQDEWQDQGSTPPVVPGAAPALAKAGVGGYASCQH